MAICWVTVFFIMKLNYFQHSMRDYWKSFCKIPEDQRDCGFFLYGQLINMFHRVLGRILPRRPLPKESDWDNLRSFDFLGKDLLENDQFRLKTGFLDRVLSVVQKQKKGGMELALLQLLLLMKTTIPFSMHVEGSSGRYVRNYCGTQPGSLNLLLVRPVLIFLCCLNSLGARKT